ncbi:uncharacterized protein BX664DRAFT_337837 [Halteromyces radiatus]|uniref:uncharacterized protein n=1 Tax=Halteromyces radiatus TaxID=101107 RepID=UPI00221F4066|nr:uncharacterized protein BX664DRAFT_337837 [Halteromyces radiatus]KAI8084812.1 hypothetical protein BX664DRAFT_337837 [Halteromyces radiatus]
MEHNTNEPSEHYKHYNDDNSPQSESSPSFHPTFDFDVEFNAHRLAVSYGNMEQATHSFIFLQSNANDNEKYRDYLIELSSHIEPIQDSALSRFFQSLPALIQSTIVNTASDHVEKSNYLQAYRILFDYIQSYPRHAYKYLIRAMKLLILGAQGDDKDKCIEILVTNLFPRLWKQRILLTHSGCLPSIKSTDGKHYIIIPCNLFEEFLRLGQRYYIDNRQWNDVIKFTCSMLECCGYDGLARLAFLSHTNRYQYLKENRHTLSVVQSDTMQPQSTPREELVSSSTSNGYLRNKSIHSSTSTSATSVLGQDADNDALSVMVAFMCEYMAVASQFTQFAYDYYCAVCVLNQEKDGDDDSQYEEKACLIPICAINNKNSNNDNNFDGDVDRSQKVSSTISSTTKPKQQSDPNGRDSDKGSSSACNEIIQEENEYRIHHQQLQHQSKKMRLDDTVGQSFGVGDGLNSSCMEGVDQTLQVLSMAADCLRHLVNLWDWATHTVPSFDWLGEFGGWEQELTRVIDAYQLPFDIFNAVLLVRSDLALSTPSIPGNLSKALKLSQSICDRIEAQRRQRKGKSHLIEYNIPFMFAFRVLYTIGVIYLLVGSLQQSTLEIAIILSVFPIPLELNDKDFIRDEIDCHTAATVFRDHEYGLMHVTQKGLTVRCIKHLIVSLGSETRQQGGMASLDSALRWDEKAGSMMVLMQYGWPYWLTRTDFWDKVIHQMKERRIFRNRGVLEYIFVPQILQALQDLHESRQVFMDILSAEFVIRNGHNHLETQSSSSSPRLLSSTNDMTTNSEDRILPSLSSLPISSKSVIRPPPPLYEPIMTNTILPSMEMSPSWYSASTQSTAQVNWMSPSFYYSRPATAVVLPRKQKRQQKSYNDDDDDDDGNTNQGEDDSKDDNNDNDEMKTSMKYNNISNEMVSRCLDQRIKRYSRNQLPAHRTRHILQLFLKNMVVKSSEDE